MFPLSRTTDNLVCLLYSRRSGLIFLPSPFVHEIWSSSIPTVKDIAKGKYALFTVLVYLSQHALKMKGEGSGLGSRFLFLFYFMHAPTEFCTPFTVMFRASKSRASYAVVSASKEVAGGELLAVSTESS